MFISVHQALVFWDELIAAFYGENNFGGNIAEIYIHTMLPGHVPTLQLETESSRDACYQACQSIYELGQLFMQRHEVELVLLRNVGGREEELTWTFLKGAYFNHRIHIKVIGGKNGN